MTDVAEQILSKALGLGADVAGIAAVPLLRRSPSSIFLEAIGSKADGVYWDPGEKNLSGIDWPPAESALVIGVSHPETALHLEHWSRIRGGTPGNRILMDINRELSHWVEGTFGLQPRRMPYGVAEGGIYLKDAAVLAGLGCIGRNNLLITPDYGGRIRLRALLIEGKLPPTGPVDYDPCRECEEFCRNACPQRAFDGRVYTARTGMTHLPGRNGAFSRARCKIQMDMDVNASAASRLRDADPPPDGSHDEDGTRRQVAYCRKCETSCPVGKS